MCSCCCFSDQPPDLEDVHILLLGAGQSGKTTILKQMELLHGDSGLDGRREDAVMIVRR